MNVIIYQLKSTEKEEKKKEKKKYSFDLEKIEF